MMNLIDLELEIRTRKKIPGSGRSMYGYIVILSALGSQQREL